MALLGLLLLRQEGSKVGTPGVEFLSQPCLKSHLRVSLRLRTYSENIEDGRLSLPTRTLDSKTCLNGQALVNLVFYLNLPLHDPDSLKLRMKSGSPLHRELLDGQVLRVVFFAPFSKVECPSVPCHQRIYKAHRSEC